VTVAVLRGDAAHLPLPDASVDLIVTSPPYWGLRSYSDGGEHYEGQIGSEETPKEWLAAMRACTREWVRVLKPSGSIFANLGDKYAAGHGGRSTEGDGDNIRVRRTRRAAEHWTGASSHPSKSTSVIVPGFRPKTLMMLPQRYAIDCVDKVGLILRAEIIWDKTNPVPESVTDRARHSHEQIFHFTKRPRYFAAMDEIREPHSAGTHPGRTRSVGDGVAHRTFAGNTDSFNPLGRTPGSVWAIPSQSLIVPDWLSHARCCDGVKRDGCEDGLDHHAAFPMELPRRCILGWSPSGGLVVDPFGGTGTTALVADSLGRIGITFDRSADYCRLARWRTADPGERARALGVPKPPPVSEGQESLFGLEAS
jgi:DNA modification methylase